MKLHRPGGGTCLNRCTPAVAAPVAEPFRDVRSAEPPTELTNDDAKPLAQELEQEVTILWFGHIHELL
jgi:hypothetical protein